MCFGSKKDVVHDSVPPSRVQQPQLDTPASEPSSSSPWSATNIRKAYSPATIKDQWSKDTIKEQWKARPGDGGKDGRKTYLAARYVSLFLKSLSHWNENLDSGPSDYGIIRVLV